jgi:hypothetical protein
LRTGFDQQAKYRETSFLSECGERINGVGDFHISIILEIAKYAQQKVLFESDD